MEPSKYGKLSKKSVSTAGKGILRLVKLQSLVAKCCKMHFAAKLCKCPDSVFSKCFSVGDALPKVGVEADFNTYSFSSVQKKCLLFELDNEAMMASKRCSSIKFLSLTFVSKSITKKVDVENRRKS